MNPLLLVGGGAALAYLLLRSKDAAASTAAPSVHEPSAPASATPTNTAAQSTPWQMPILVTSTGSIPIPVGAGAPPTKGTPPAPAPTKPPQITIPARPGSGEVAAPKQPPTVVQLAGRWGWPVPRYEGRAPVISDGFGSPRPPGKHMGVDLMFGRIASDPFPIGPNGTKGFIMPDAWMAIAASDGVLWSAGYTPRGFAAVVDHGNVATFYQHMDTLFVPETKPPGKGTPRDRLIPIRAGQPLGVIGADPLDPSRLKHLHFELWAGGPDKAIDPVPLMKSWLVFGPGDVAPFLPSLHRNAAKKRSGKRSEFVSVRGYERRWPGSSLNPPR
jgi:murein DD-endopeptidase MepM/ murein hydrolase activator NlpD